MAVFIFPFSVQRAAVLSDVWYISFRSAFFSAEVAARESVNWRLLLPSAHVQREHPLQNLLLLFTQCECEKQRSCSAVSPTHWYVTSCRQEQRGTSLWTSDNGCCLTQECRLCGWWGSSLCWALLCIVILQWLQKYCVTITVLRVCKERSRVDLMGRTWPDGVQAEMVPPPEHLWLTAAFVRRKQPRTSIECKVEVLVVFDLFSSSRREIL